MIKSMFIALILMPILISCRISIQSSSNDYSSSNQQEAPSNPYKYITTAFVDRVSKCKINPSDGSLSDCIIAADSNPSFSIISAVSTYKNYGYVTNYGTNSVSVCQIDLNGTWRNCMDAGVTGLSNPNSIVFADDGMVYITNNLSNSITVCSEVNDNGTLNNCHNTTALFNRPSGIIINGNDAYVSNHGDNLIYKCTRVGNDLSNCNNLYPTSLFFCPQNMDFFQGSIYIVNACSDTVSICSISTGSCMKSMHFFDLPTGIKIQNSKAYITLQLGGVIELCSIDRQTGLFNKCEPATDHDFGIPTIGIF